MSPACASWSGQVVWENQSVLGHIGLNVPDLVAAQAYYGKLLPLLGFELYLADDDQCAYKPAGGKPGTYLFLYPAADLTPYSRDKTGLQHLAFMAKTRGDVDRVHAHVLSLGGEVIHPPRVFHEYPPPYYATFWLDPFGIMLEAVCHYDRD
jgi:catechol 2,3-dioxygenase-like lactoylglutathione lyase family enzyme